MLGIICVIYNFVITIMRHITINPRQMTRKESVLLYHKPFNFPVPL